MSIDATQKQFLQKLIQEEVFVTSETQRIVSESGEESKWLFDFRKILLRADVLNTLSRIFWDIFEHKTPFQIGCLEVAGIPLMTALSLKSAEYGYPTNAFFIRKSRKKHGLLNMIEGTLTDEKVILVDDILNSGKSFMRQVEVLEALGKKVDSVFVILRFRDLSYYTYFHEKGIKIISLFTLDDFSDILPVRNLIQKEADPIITPFSIAWYFKSENPNYFYVVPKSAPAIDETKIYFGSDSGNFWALNQSDGSIAWKYKVGFHAKGKYIFSSPVIYKGLVYFGAYDGNLYALNSETGKLVWTYMEADWIGSSPCISKRNGYIYVGLEFGLWKKRGGVVALDAHTGKKVWEYTMSEHVHASPAYAEKSDILVCGSNNHVVYAFQGSTGKLLWEYTTEGEVKESCAIDEERGVVAFGSFDGCVYVLDLKSGKLRLKVKTDAAIYSTPYMHGGVLYATSLDKKIYAIETTSGKVLWTFATAGRIFASPFVAKDTLYCGSNDGRLYLLDIKSGKNVGLFQATERITNQVVYNTETNTLFVPTFANEIYALVPKKNSDTNAQQG